MPAVLRNRILHQTNVFFPFGVLNRHLRFSYQNGFRAFEARDGAQGVLRHDGRVPGSEGALSNPNTVDDSRWALKSQAW